MEKSEFQKMLGEGLTEFKAGMMTEIKTEIKNAVAPLEQKVEKIEKLPAHRVFGDAPAAGTSKKYRGYALGKQLENIRNIAAKNPRMYPILSNDEKAEDFAKFLIAYTRVTKGDMSAMADINEFQQKYAVNKASYAEGADATGGYLVPEEFEREIMMIARDSSFALQECSIYEMTSDTLLVPKEGTLVQVAWRDEAGAVAAGEGTFDQIALAAKSLAGLATISNELLQDSAFDLAGILLEQFSYATGQELDNQLFNGTGSPFTGVSGSAAGYSVVLSSGSTLFSNVRADDFSMMMSLLKQGYRAGSKFVLNRSMIHYLRILKDTSNQPIFAQPGATVPGTIYGTPYSESEVFNGTNAANKAFAVLGNFKKFAVGRRVGTMTLEADPYGLFANNQTRFRMVTRWAEKIGIAQAFVRGMTAAS